VLYAPGDDVEMKYYSDSLAITGTNSVTTKSLNLYAKVTSELRGSLAFHVANSLGQVVPDASVRVRSALDGTERTGFKTDANGDVVISDLMEGRWHWQVSASGHAHAGRHRAGRSRSGDFGRADPDARISDGDLHGRSGAVHRPL
jgi:hypothetical protein